MHICVIALDDVFDTGLSVVLDTFETASGLAARPELRARVSIVGVRRRAKTHQGFVVPLAPLPRVRPDVVVVPGLGAKTPDALDLALVRRDVGEAGEVLREWAAAGTLVAAACTATFVLAAAGLLDRRRATTTWWLAPYFRQRFPLVRLDDAQMIVESRGVVTAGTAMAHLDLALWLVRRQSPSLARTVARHLVYDARPSQAAYAMPDHLAHADPVVERFEQWARRHLADFSLPAAARGVGASERTLERRLRAVLGRSPLSFVRDLRVERAVHRLQTTRDSIDEIAAAVGYEDGVTLRTLLRKKTGRGLRELRALGNP
jgi:transcriptional regulator GlxA family with amidase domain